MAAFEKLVQPTPKQPAVLPATVSCALAIDGGDGCVEPSVENAQNGTYAPLSRPLFVYAKNESFARPQVAAFVQYTLDNETEIAEASQFVPLTDEQLEQAQADFAAAVEAAG